MLGDEFHIPVLGATVLRLVLDPKIRQLQMSVDNRELLGVGERLEIGLVTRVCLLKSPFSLIALILLAILTYASRPSCPLSSRSC